MNWLNLIYIYQPPTQKKDIVKNIIEKSYIPLLNFFIKNKDKKMLFNINAGFTDYLYKNGYISIIEQINILLKRKQIEITDTAAYQAFLPILPKNEIIRQIDLNRDLHKTYFGENYQTNGFFSPSLAFNNEIFKILKERGYKWIVLDETAINTKINSSAIYQKDNINIYIRNREYSFSILTTDTDNVAILKNKMLKHFKKNQFLFTAIDGETFGYNRPNFEKLLFNIYKDIEIKSILPNEIEKIIVKREKIEPQISTWIVPLKSDYQNSSFSRWKDPRNKIQNLQNRLKDLAIKTVNTSKFQIKDPLIIKDNPEYLNEREMTWLKARYLLDQALFQDQFLYSSARPLWNAEIIEKGAFDLYKSIELTPDAKEKDLNLGKKLYEDIAIVSIEWQNDGTIQKKIQTFFEEEKVKENTNDKNIRKGYIEGIQRLTKEMQKAINKEEYEIASSLKERILEIKEKELNLEK